MRRHTWCDSANGWISSTGSPCPTRRYRSGEVRIPARYDTPAGGAGFVTHS
ncbi:hypothetical protein GCM10023094_22540 [Rhodococcus olei]|uniref:Uncharacterized protein n=1 Tax=Rhodococcus olei TaxID=2161675 RepID=A0ABP8P2G2_9NOCA